MSTAILTRDRPAISRDLASTLLAPAVRPAGVWRAVCFACSWLSVTGLLVLSAALINPAAAALPAGLRNLVDNATGGSAPAASAAQAASTPTLASQAELARSLDSLIGTLESDPQRKALIAQLKGLRAGTQSIAPVVPVSSA